MMRGELPRRDAPGWPFRLLAQACSLAGREAEDVRSWRDVVVVTGRKPWRLALLPRMGVWQAGDLGGRIARLGGIVRNAAREVLRKTSSGFAGRGSLWPAENPGGRLLLEAEDLGS